MLKSLKRAMALAFLFLASGACSDVTGPRMATDFNWGEVQDPETVVEGVTTTVALGDLLMLGQFNTPTRCFALGADFQKKDNNLTVRVSARSSNSPNCDQRMGGFRYTASIAALKFGTYDLKIVHVVAGEVRGEYTETVTIQ